MIANSYLLVFDTTALGKRELSVNLQLRFEKVFFSLENLFFFFFPSPIPGREDFSIWCKGPGGPCLKRQECLFPALPAVGRDAGCPGLPACCGSRLLLRQQVGRETGSERGKANAVPASSRTQHFPLLLALFAFLFGLPPRWSGDF